MTFKPITLEIPTIAVAKSRAKRSASGIAYIPKKTKSFEAELRWHWQKSGHAMIPVVPTNLFVTIFLPKPKKTKLKSTIPIVRPDIDNYLKSILDGLNGFAWKDDSQVSCVAIGKRYTIGTPKILITISKDCGGEA